VQRGFLDLSVVERFEVTPKEIERLRLRSDDILVVEGNGSIDQIGRNALFLDDGQEWVHQNHVIRVRLEQRLCLPVFVSRYLNSLEGWAQMVEKAQTTSGLYTLPAGKVADLEVPVPSLSVQRTAISALDADAVCSRSTIAAAEAELAAIEALPAALLREAFSFAA
jgi:type I restriction enzyme S subunit